MLKKVPRVLYSTYENKNLINQAVKQTFWMEIVFKVAPIKHVHLSVNYIGKCAPFAESFEICQIFLWHADIWWSETSNREHGNMQQSNKKKSGNKMFGALSVVASTIYFFIQNTPSWIVWWLFFRTPLLCKWHVPLLLSSFFLFILLRSIARWRAKIFSSTQTMAQISAYASMIMLQTWNK